MNLFWLSDDPEEAARLNCDQHVVATIREGAILLHGALSLHLEEEPDGYEMYDVFKESAHPSNMARWMAESRENWVKGYRLVRCLNQEFKLRDRKKSPDRSSHGSWDVTEPLWDLRFAIPSNGETPVTQAHMPSEYRSEDPEDYVAAYRRYYRNDKQEFDNGPAVWSEPRSKPEFMRIEEDEGVIGELSV